MDVSSRQRRFDQAPLRPTWWWRTSTATAGRIWVTANRNDQHRRRAARQRRRLLPAQHAFAAGSYPTGQRWRTLTATASSSIVTNSDKTTVSVLLGTATAPSNPSNPSTLAPVLGSGSGGGRSTAMASPTWSWPTVPGNSVSVLWATGTAPSGRSSASASRVPRGGGGVATSRRRQARSGSGLLWQIHLRRVYSYYYGYYYSSLAVAG